MPESGSVTVSVTVSDGNCSVSIDTTITVLEHCVAINPPIGPLTQAVCKGQAIAAIVYPTEGVTGAAQVSYSGFPAGLSTGWADNAVTISGTPTQTGTFDYTITATGPENSANVTGSLTVYARPSLSGANSPSLCSGEAASLTVNGSEAGTYSWVVGDAPAQTTASGSYTTASLAASATYSVTLKNANCLSEAATGVITMHEPPVLSAANSPARCGPGTVTLSATATGGVTGAMTYTWNVGGNSYTTSTPEYTTGSIATSGSYSVQAVNEHLCESNTVGGTITIGAPITLSSPSNPSRCGAGGVSLSVSVSGAAGAMSYTWTIDGTPYTTTSPSYYISSVTNSTGYSVKATNDANCESNTVNGNITVDFTPAGQYSPSNACGCASGLIKCSNGYCQTNTSGSYNSSDCTGNCQEAWIYYTDGCGIHPDIKLGRRFYEYCGVDQCPDRCSCGTSSHLLYHRVCDRYFKTYSTSTSCATCAQDCVNVSRGTGGRMVGNDCYCQF
jgi:hypothetical protein